MFRILFVGLILSSSSPVLRPGPAHEDVRLAVAPEAVYKISDSGRRNTESWYLNVLVVDERDREGIRPLHAEVEVFSGDELRQRIELPASTLEGMRRMSYRVTEETPEITPRRLFTLDEVFDLRLEFPTRPASWESDRVRVTLRLAVPGEGEILRTLEVPLRTYAQRTELIFPMRGRGIVTQGQINNWGHSGQTNRFAVDVMGLNEEYGPMLAEGEGNAAFAGWGREIIAPAAGTVVYVRNDVPDNPSDGGDPRDTYGSLPDPILAIAGNAVIIDHGTGEFSALMHMREGSITVGVGDAVEQGQVVGRMGASGDAFGVHLHYQLQDGPELFRANSLPVEFENVGALARGVFFDAG